MMHINKHIVTLRAISSLLAAMALAACSDKGGVEDIVTPPTPNPEPTPEVVKTPIEMTLGGVEGATMTRAVITNNPNNPQNFFHKTLATKVFMVMQSDYDTGHEDYQGSKDTKYVVARGDVAANSNAIVFDDTNKRYWDDAHARSSMLNVWAYAQIGETWTEVTFEEPNPGGTGMNAYKEASFQTTNKFDWRTTPQILPAIFNWKASINSDDSQNAQTVRCQDLLFSNNLANNGEGNDGRLKFDFVNRKFPQVGEAQMKFYRAMSKITIKIKEGDGFTTATTDFKFTSGNVSLKGFNTKGLFSIKNGQFEHIHETKTIPSIYLVSTSADGSEHVLEALVIPNIHEYLSDHGGENLESRFVKDKKNLDTDVMMEFTIDNNKYQITSGALYDALKGKEGATEKKPEDVPYIPLEPGKNYVFTFVIGKTKVKDMSAQVATWEEVTAEETNPSNARIKLRVEERGTPQSANVDFYRKADNKTTDGVDDAWTIYNWVTGYQVATNPTYSTNHFETEWFWENNKSFYHFRSLMPKSTESNPTTVTIDSSIGDYVALTAAESSSTTPYKDICWGAPMLDNGDNETAGTFLWHYGPTINGFDAKDDGTVATGLPDGSQHQIYKAIGPTEDQIKLIMFHMMSDVTIVVKTESGDAGINLGDGEDNNCTKIELKNIATTGKLKMGNGLVLADSPVGYYQFTAHPAPSTSTGAITWSHYGAIPQALDDVVLVITTPDDNKYEVNMMNLIAATSGGSAAVTSNNIVNPYQETETDSGKYKIDRWYPNFKYTYTFTLKKKGVYDLAVTILDWENVIAGDDNVQIK